MTVKLLWVPPAVVVLVAFALTKSRGGLLSLLAGLAVWMVSRFGIKKAMWLGVLVMPLIFVAFAGRQTNINLDADDTAQSRIRLWRDGIGFIKSSPLLGVGYQTYGWRTDNVAHNSYLHCYAELGFFGGTMFLGAFLLPILALCSPTTQAKLKKLTDFALPASDLLTGEEVIPQELGRDLEHLRSSMLAIVIAYGVGLFSLSRSYEFSTYLMLGLVCATARLIAAKNPSAVLRFSTRTCLIVFVVSFFWLAYLFVFVRVMVKASGH